ncbi:MAG TPA: zinc ribbon domain-containing protein [Treponemataceae bacterium]|nr:zinc ribbon domain-containing protein [Treponemataceae bacterium]
MSKKPRFFCEYCSSEVKQNDKFCSKCGKFFASVKCPSCGFSGDSRVFRDGCPACGYALYDKSAKHNSIPEKAKKNTETDPLPWWMYIVAISFFIFILMFAISRL